MKLSAVMAGTDAKRVAGPSGDPEIRRVTCDSRQVEPGSLFFALAGAKADGSQFAREAVKKGAVAVVSEKAIEGLGDAQAFEAPNGRRAMAVAAANFFGRPANAMTLLGVTGTNGKTTTTYLVESILAAAGEKPGVVGTVSYRFGGKEIPAPNTTPESTALQELLAQMKAAGTTSVVMEVSSHALAQERAHGLSFTSAAFTNLTRDHLDYHLDMESYFAAKRRLFFELLAGPATINTDDSWGQRLLDELGREGRTAWGFSASGRTADLYVRDCKTSIEGMQGTLVTPRGESPFKTRLVGAHNLENILTAAGLALGAAFDLKDIVKGIEALSNVPGRLERVSGKGIHVFVDYAHSDDALTRALAALRPLTTGKLVAVFGCGGDRDKGKRPMMGEAAGKGSDLAIVTSDNPRTEDPQAILEAILPGLAKAGAKGFKVEPDRRKAIELAVSLTRPGDVILLAGKGHEDYQIVGTTKHHFDDREEARRALGVTP
ncbi:MAG TPA: UDP-N-acetylmuramoyl-L-alanyl-D-glutamate--2,6-diaminopimelate ligase [Myxococcales bacterium]|jgi:UDP-N-acetylmuramoyl-L-alanyl-D-glutamate--2,6-diaminopimelate ligase